MVQCRGVKLIFTGSHISLVVAFKGRNIILGLYKCNYLTIKRGLSRNEVEVQIQPTGLVFATCGLVKISLKQTVLVLVPPQLGYINLGKMPLH